MPTSEIEEHSPSLYRASWYDRLVTWFENLPGPTWLVYGVAAMLAILLNNAVRWVDGSLPSWTFDPARVFESPLLLFYLPMNTYLNAAAKKSLVDFRPLLDVSGEEFLKMKHELTTIPQRSGRMTASPFIFFYEVIVASALMGLALTFLVRIIRLLRLVDHVQRKATGISLFHTAPVYAFSSLTSRAGMSIIALFYYYIFVAYTLEIYGPNPPRTVVDYLAFGTLFLSGFAAFIVPLGGIHGRLVEEKAKGIAEVNARIELAIARLHKEVDEDDFAEAEQVKEVLTGLFAEAEVLAKISTWPWKPETLRGFLSAVILPIVIWLITTLLGNVLPE
jgi:hypothetical protein